MSQQLLAHTKYVFIDYPAQILFLYFGFKLLRDAYEMDGAGPSEELQEVEEELRKSKGDGKEQEEDGEECDIVGNVTGEGGDVEKGNVSSMAKLAKQNLAAENLKVFTQVAHRVTISSVPLFVFRVAQHIRSVPMHHQLDSQQPLCCVFGFIYAGVYADFPG